jgi:hypothetical protein
MALEKISVKNRFLVFVLTITTTKQGKFFFWGGFYSYVWEQAKKATYLKKDENLG